VELQVKFINSSLHVKIVTKCIPPSAIKVSAIRGKNVKDIKEKKKYL